MRRAAGPLATFPGFEQLPDGGSRLFVQLSQTVAVEERRAQGSVTYVLRGAHLRVNNDARSELTQLDEQEPEAIERHRDEEVRKAGA